MTEQDFERLWETLRSAANVDNLHYDESVTIGGVFGKMKEEIRRLQNELEEAERYMNYKEDE